MKRIICILLAFIMLALSACTGGGSDTEATTGEAPSQTTTEDSRTVRLTFPEGMTLSEIALKLEENGVCSASEFMAAADDATFAADYSFASGLTKENRAFLLEGYIFPDTYDFFRGESARKALSRFLINAETKFDGLEEKAAALGYTLDEIITIASIVQEEATSPEMARVSSVLHNRLDDGMQLQCDVTIAYLKNSVMPYLDGDVERYNAYYNTYKCPALPTGPICSPGMDAVIAALNPAYTDYLFFVTDKADPTVFYYSGDYDEHLKNCETAGW